MPDLFLKADIDQLIKLGVHGNQVYAERHPRQGARPLNLRTQQVGRHRATGQNAKAIGIRDRGDKIALADPAHRAAHNGGFGAKKITAALHQRA